VQGGKATIWAGAFLKKAKQATREEKGKKKRVAHGEGRGEKGKGEGAWIRQGVRHPALQLTKEKRIPNTRVTKEEKKKKKEKVLFNI